jgi:AraC-like DNA-binding protein
MAPRYSEKEIEFLLKNAKLDYHELTRIFNKKFKQNRSASSIDLWLRAHDLNIKSTRVTGEQLKFLQKNVMLNRKDLTRLFNKKFKLNKSVKAISTLIYTHGLAVTINRYTEDHINFFQNNFKLSGSEFIRLFNKTFAQNRTLGSIKYLRKKHGVSAKRYVFTEKQVEFLRKNINLNRTALTALFNKKFKQDNSVCSICSFLSKHGLTKKRKNTRMYNEEF